MVPRLIKLTKAQDRHSDNSHSDDIVINALKILTIEETHEKEDGNARIVMENGKSIYVEENMDEILDMANE
ncbi:MAG: hypothetical protein H6581_14215 [Bacteroidia bacterium]|nr:hypothetical protein [Bacteroidia bacterium]